MSPSLGWRPAPWEHTWGSGAQAQQQDAQTRPRCVSAQGQRGGQQWEPGIFRAHSVLGSINRGIVSTMRRVSVQLCSVPIRMYLEGWAPFRCSSLWGVNTADKPLFKEDRGWAGVTSGLGDTEPPEDRASQGSGSCLQQHGGLSYRMGAGVGRRQTCSVGPERVA